VRFRLKEPWPDFMTFYASPATGASWIVPKKYVEKVGEEGFKKAPVGAGPYKLASFNPGIELVFDSHDRYWRKTPAVKRLVWRTVTEDLTRLAMLKRGEVDVAYSLRGTLGEEAKRTPGITLKPVVISATQWLDFGPLQWDPKSPWHDRRVRLAAALAFDKNAINQAETLGHSKPTGSIIPSAFEFALPIQPYPYDPAQAKKLLAEAGYPRGFDAVEVSTDAVYATTIEAVVNSLQPIGIRAKVRPIERAAFYKMDTEKAFKHLSRTSSAAAGNAATRIEAFVLSTGIRAYGGYPDIDGLYREQQSEMDPKRREAALHKIQQLMHERVMFAPIMEPAFLNGYGPRVAESGLALITGFLYSGPYEELKLKE